jgi:NitT/TauT family transport system substrate-binding protein
MSRVCTLALAALLLSACAEDAGPAPRDAAVSSSTTREAAADDPGDEPDAESAPASATELDASAADAGGAREAGSADAAQSTDAARTADATVVSDAASSPAPTLRISSDTASIEFTPALYAARNLYPGMASVSSGGIVNLFNSMQADLGTNAETQALRQSAEHPNLRILCTVTETFYRIVARRSSGIAQLADLRGKRVGTITNTSAHYYLDKMLRTVGLTAADVSVVSVVPLSRMATMLQGGQVDALTSWEPEPQRAADAIGADLIEFQDRSVYREIVNLHTTRERLADPEKRRGMVAFVRALMRAADIFQNQPEQVLPFVSETLGQPQPLLMKVWHLERFPGRLVPDLLDVLEQEEPWVARQTGRTPRTRMQLAELIDDSVLKEAMAMP